MNIAIFTSAAALLLGLAKRREENLQDRDIKKPQYPAIRDRVVSMYPLSFASFNDVLGAFPLACSRVFPESKFIGYSTFSYSKKVPSFDVFVSSELKSKFPNAVEINENNMYAPQRADLTFYKLNLKDKKSQWHSKTKNYFIDVSKKENLQSFLQIFEWSKSNDVIIEVDYSRSEARGREGFFKDKDKIESIVNMLKKESSKLKQLELYINLIDACPYSGQRDVRLFITTFPLETKKEIKKELIDSFVVNLDPISRIQSSLPLPQMDAMRRSENSPIGKRYKLNETDIYNTFFDKKNNPLSDKGNFSRTGEFREDQPRYPEKCAKRMQTNPIWRPYLLEDWRLNTEFPILRYFSLGELERLAGFPTGWIIDRNSQDRGRALHIASNPLILEYIIVSYCLHNFKRFKPGVYYA